MSDTSEQRRRIVSSDGAGLAALIDAFKRAWEDGPPPELAAFLPSASAERHEALCKLAAVDLEYRWKRADAIDSVAGSLDDTGGGRPKVGLPTRPRVEDYQREFPELDQTDDRFVDLVAWEYDVRHRCGDRPTHTEYATRFSALGEALSAALAAIDAELAAERPARIHDKATILPTTRDHIAADDVGEASLLLMSGPPATPTHFGRYTVTAKLGEGGYGVVHRGFDTELRRDVAIKVPRRERIENPADAEAYLAEARVLASLDHVGIVPVYDMGRTDDGLCYVVSKFMPGGDLARLIATSRPPHDEAADLLVRIADALHYAHKRGLVHRDIKPGNILLDEAGHPLVADFGLALPDDAFGTGSLYCGTPRYMSPEQARGEGHRVDARSDIYSLGIVFYELLTGRSPYRYQMPELLDEITSGETRPPRQLDDKIPKELERICLKAVAKRAADRYTTALDLADDLRHWQAKRKTRRAERRAATPEFVIALTPGTPAASPKTPSYSAPQPAPLAKVVPKGLRSFDGDDADFFLQLLPGPTDRDGLPESIRFWKTRVERTDADTTFSVGLIYGPSGCGKSSQVKAGLLPRLAEHVLPVYLEATSDDTEARLLKGLRKVCPDLQPADLVETLASLRRGKGLATCQKVLIVLDQFEQWLHAHRDKRGTELVRALRHCDGGHVQCIVMVRDDFWMAASRFLRELEIPLLEGENSAAVDLFDAIHARRVLAIFGRSFGRLPEQGELPTENVQFLDQAVTGLAEDGNVVSVRLSLFSEMVKGKPWTPATVVAIGGIAGVGATFLEETFSASTAPPRHRLHQQAARGVLKALLPEAGADIKGHRRSATELLAASGYERRPAEFAELLRILDAELRLVTPADEEAQNDEEQRSEAETDSPAPSFYQLTHDYLVPSLRDWLSRKQRETRRGRAELRLADRSAAWNAKPDARFLPSWWEWPNILLFTKRGKWTAPERRTMSAARRYHLTRGGVLLALFSVVTFGVIWGRLRLIAQRETELAAAFVKRLIEADTVKVADILPNFAPHRQRAEPELVSIVAGSKYNDEAKLRASLALFSVDPRQVEYLRERLLSAKPDELLLIREQLQGCAPKLTADLWKLAESNDAADSQRFRAACALARFEPTGDGWQRIATHTAAQLVAQSVQDLGQWMTALRTSREALVEPLSSIFRDELREPAVREIAATVLADYAGDDPARLVELAVVAEPKQFEIIFPKLADKENRGRAIELLEADVERSQAQPLRDWKDPRLDPSWPDPTVGTAAQLVAALGMLESRYAFCQTLPLDSFDAVATELRVSGYRLVRLRPYASGDSVQVAAIWHRDSSNCATAIDLTADELRTRDTEMQAAGYVPLDVAGYYAGLAAAVRPDNSLPVARFAAVWTRRTDDGDEHRLYVEQASWSRTEEVELSRQGFSLATLQSYSSPTYGSRYAMIQSKFAGPWEGVWETDRWSYLAKTDLYGMQLDISLSRGEVGQPERADPVERLARAEKAVAANTDDVNARFERGQAHFVAGNLQAAVDDLKFVAKKSPNSAETFRWRAQANARLGQADEARADLERLSGFTSDREIAYLNALVTAQLGKPEAGLDRLEAAVAQNSQDEKFLYSAACAAARLSALFPNDASERREAVKRRAIELLAHAIKRGFYNFSQMQSDPDLDALQDDPDFQALLAVGNLQRRYTAVFRGNSGKPIASAQLQGLRPDAHLARCRELAALGYRPAAISLADMAPTGAASPDLVAASVWRLVKTDLAAKARLAVRQAHSLAALVKLGRADDVWPHLTHSREPDVRTSLLHLLAPLRVNPSVIVERLFAQGGGLAIENILFDSETSIRRALILALGEYDEEHLSSSARDALVPRLTSLYRDDPDAGIHGACDWILRRWGHAEAVDAIDGEVASRQLPPQRRWYVNGQRQTLAIVHGPLEFQMGSPLDSPLQRIYETPHLRRIGRSFAIAVKELTYAEIQRFPNSGYVGTGNLPAAPVHYVSWYVAVAYCNWLSEQEGLPKDQWCYEPNDKGEYAVGMKPAENYLERTGYRLPTEAEWEFACRGGATTSYAFGDDLASLRHYAWYDLSAKLEETPLTELAPRTRTEAGLLAVLERMLHDRSWAMPVGRLKPNDLGLFDVHGNLLEWCDSPYTVYPIVGEMAVDDAGTLEVVNDQNLRVLRGGAFSDDPLSVRSAARNQTKPALWDIYRGFRVARTYPSTLPHP